MGWSSICYCIYIKNKIETLVDEVESTISDIKQDNATSKKMIDTKATYLFFEHIVTEPILTVYYAYIQYTDNESQMETLRDIIEIVHEDLHNQSIHLYEVPLKGTTVADISDDIPATILTGKLRNMKDFHADVIDGLINAEEILTKPENLMELLENKSTIEQFIPDYYQTVEKDKED